MSKKKKPWGSRRVRVSSPCHHLPALMSPSPTLSFCNICITVYKTVSEILKKKKNFYLRSSRRASVVVDYDHREGKFFVNVKEEGELKDGKVIFYNLGS